VGVDLRSPSLRAVPIDLSQTTLRDGTLAIRGVFRSVAVKSITPGWTGTLSLRLGHAGNPIPVVQGDVIWLEDPVTRQPVAFDQIAFDIASPVAGTAVIMPSADLFRGVVGMAQGQTVARSDGATFVASRGAGKELNSSVALGVATAAQLLAANALRRAALVVNNDPATPIFVGQSNAVTVGAGANAGYRIGPLGRERFETTQVLWAISAAAVDVRIMEETD
jgi:hypothetical protein